MTKFKGLQLHHLPHDVLRIILSRLALKEAVRMSILSRRWRRLWKCYPKLVFTRATMCGSNAVVGYRKPLRTRFIRGVNSILRQLRSTNLNKFVVKFALRKRHTPHIDRWIKFSAASKTKHVVMDLSPGLKGSNKRDDMYSFPLHLFSGSSGSCVRSLSLAFVYLTLPPDLHGFANLKKLSLHMVTITGELQRLFLECAVLEWLSITKCRMVGLSIGRELSRLQYLCVKICSLQKLDIQAPNLTTLVFADLMVPIMLHEPLKISEATISLLSASDCFNYVCTDVVNALPHVQSLSIYFQMNTKVQGFVKNPTRLTNLRHLTLEINIGGRPEAPGGVLRLAYLLELAPLLEDLVIHMCCFASATHMWEPSVDPSPLPPHNHLKTIRMTGFYGLNCQLELAHHLLRNTTALERMIIDPVVGNNSFIPSLKAAQRYMRDGRALAFAKLWRKGFDGVLTIL
ncbi:hypothetical protein ACQJBY_018152 [Aegilops geniculata]